MVSENARAGEAHTYTQEQILNCVIDKAHMCPCCDTEFFDRAVNEEDLQLCGRQSGLRNIYEPVDPILYDIICCVNCGYASLSSTFSSLSFKQAQLVTNHITPRFKTKEFPKIYTHHIGVIRYKHALQSALVIRRKSSEIACLYMRLAWIYRSLGDEDAEKRMMLAAVEGFLEAFDKEFYPFIDMNEDAALYVVGDLLYRLSKTEQAQSFFHKALGANDISLGIKTLIKEHPLGLTVL